MVGVGGIVYEKYIISEKTNCKVLKVKRSQEVDLLEEFPPYTGRHMADVGSSRSTGIPQNLYPG